MARFTGHEPEGGLSMYETDQTTTDDHSAGGSATAAGYTQFGEHVASVLRAAEAAAERLTESAQREADDLRAQARVAREQADVYAEQKQREAEANAARAMEGAELAAYQHIQEIKQRNDALHKDLSLAETRLRDLVAGLRTLASHLEGLLGSNDSEDVEEELPASLNATAGAHASAHADG
jgi:hypothetical protein